MTHLPYDQEKRLADLIESEVIEEMKGVAEVALRDTLLEGHARDTAEFILARFRRRLTMTTITFFDAKHALEG